MRTKFTPYPVSLQNFKSWKIDHENSNHVLLQCDDERVKSRGIVCIDCQCWYKVLIKDFDSDSELVSWSKKQTYRATTRIEDFKWITISK